MPFTQCFPNVYYLQEKYTRCFLLIGKKQAVLMDSGLGELDVLRLVKEITDLPLMFVNSHAHTDHIGASLSFPGGVWAHKDEMPFLRNSLGDNLILHELKDGQYLDLGSLQVLVLHLPGHTPGSIALLEKNGEFLLAADQVSSFHVFMTGHCSMEDYQHSLKRLLTLPQIQNKTKIFAAHGELVLGREVLDKTLKLTQKIVEGMKPVRKESIPRDVRLNGGKSFQVPRIMNVFELDKISILTDATE